MMLCCASLVSLSDATVDSKIELLGATCNINLVIAKRRRPYLGHELQHIVAGFKLKAISAGAIRFRGSCNIVAGIYCLDGVVGNWAVARCGVATDWPGRPLSYRTGEIS